MKVERDGGVVEGEVREGVVESFAMTIPGSDRGPIIGASFLTRVRIRDVFTSVSNNHLEWRFKPYYHVQSVFIMAPNRPNRSF